MEIGMVIDILGTAMLSSLIAYIVGLGIAVVGLAVWFVYSMVRGCIDAMNREPCHGDWY